MTTIHNWHTREASALRTDMSAKAFRRARPLVGVRGGAAARRGAAARATAAAAAAGPAPRPRLLLHPTPPLRHHTDVTLGLAHPAIHNDELSILFSSTDPVRTLEAGGGERRWGPGEGERRLRRGGDRPNERPEGAAPDREGGPGGVRRRLRSALRRRYGDLQGTDQVSELDPAQNTNKNMSSGAKRGAAAMAAVAR